MLCLWVLVIQQAERNKIIQLSQESSMVYVFIQYLMASL
jgi:hypothetical protein